MWSSVSREWWTSMTVTSDDAWWRVTTGWRRDDNEMTTGWRRDVWHRTQAYDMSQGQVWHRTQAYDMSCRRHVVVMSSSCRRRAGACRRRAVVVPSSCRRRVVVVSSLCRRRVVVTSSSGRRHVVACCPSRFWPFSSVYLLNYDKLRLSKW